MRPIARRNSRETCICEQPSWTAISSCSGRGRTAGQPRSARSPLAGGRPPHRPGGCVARVAPGQQARRVIDELGSSVWAFAVLTAALEAGLLELLAEPQDLGATSARSGLDPSLAEGILEVLVALGLAHRDGQVVVAGPGLAPLLGSEAKEVFVAQLRSTDLQSRQLIDGARHGGLAPGWQHTDPELLEAQGRSGRAPSWPWCRPSARTRSWRRGWASPRRASWTWGWGLG